MANDRDSAGGAETLRQRVAPLPPTLRNGRAPVLTSVLHMTVLYMRHWRGRPCREWCRRPCAR
jgi:hypothetical protein